MTAKTNPVPSPVTGITLRDSISPGDLVIHRPDGREIPVGGVLDDINLRVEVLSEVMDEILEHTGITKMTIHDRVEAKLMLKKLSS